MPESTLREVTSYCVERGIPGEPGSGADVKNRFIENMACSTVWFEPTSKAKSTKVIPTLRATLPQSEQAPVTYISPNILELEQIFRGAREPSIRQGAELPPLTSLARWFERIDRLGFQAGISTDVFARLGGPEGSFLSKNGIIQMSVQLLPFFQHLIVKCGDKGMYNSAAMHIQSPRLTDVAVQASLLLCRSVLVRQIVKLGC